MIIWWTSLSTIMKVLWAVTLSASLIFVIQTIMTFLGVSGDTDLDGGGSIDAAGNVDIGGGDSSFDADPSMSLLTFRNFVNFCLGFGWTAVILHEKIASSALLLIISVLVGIGLVIGVMWIFKWLSGMQQSGNIYLQKSAVGTEGTVYLTIPGERKGHGKIQISINDSVREYDALTDGKEIKTGSSIKVIEVINDSTLLVEELGSEII